MSRLKKLYNISITGSSKGFEEAIRRKEEYEKQKSDYIRKCKDERKERYSFLQRNRKYIGILCFFFMTLSIIGLNSYMENERMQNTNKSNEEVLSPNIVSGDSVSENDKNSTYAEQINAIDDSMNTDEENDKKQTIYVGMKVNFIGNIHYQSSYSDAEGTNCLSGKAIVTRINQDEAHPYHLEFCEERCTVYGWVNEEDIEIVDVLEID